MTDYSEIIGRRPRRTLNLLNGVKALRLDDIDRAQRHLNIKVTVRPR